jgi:phospholipase C
VSSGRHIEAQPASGKHTKQVTMREDRHVAGVIKGNRRRPWPPLPDPAASGIDHVIVVMENRSFEHFLGWMPGADGEQSGMRYADRCGIPHATHHLATYQGCASPDPDHSNKVVGSSSMMASLTAG